MWLTVSEYILGIKPDYDGLLIDPCLPATAGDYTVTRRFRDAVYDITIHPNGSQKGVRQIVVDGTPVSGTLIPYAPGRHQVEVRL
jgi:cellobiose phosphorylase